MFRKKTVLDLKNERQINLNRFLRIGRIINVYPESSECYIEWVDYPGGGIRTKITSGNPGFNVLPKKGQYVICGADFWGRIFILTYLPMGYEEKLKVKNEIPASISEEDIFISRNNNYFWIKNNGTIILGNPISFILLSNIENNSILVKTINYSLKSEAINSYYGIAQRIDSETQNIENLKLIKPNNEIKFINEIYEKYYEYSDGYSGYGDEKPIVEFYIANYIDKEGKTKTPGFILNNDNKDAKSRNEEICYLLKVNLDNKNVIFLIDKSGNVWFNSSRININNGKVDKGKKLFGEEEYKNSERGQHLARENDKVYIPLALQYEDKDHSDVAKSIIEDNLKVLQSLVSCIVSPVGPCVLDITRLEKNGKLIGYIAEGSDNIYVGG